MRSGGGTTTDHLVRKRAFAWLGAALAVCGLLLLAGPAGAGVAQWTTAGPSGISVGAMAVSPDFANDRTLFAGTYSNYGYAGQGVFRSTDGGQSWAQCGPAGATVRSLALSPVYPADRTVFAGTSGGLYKSVDGGGAWTKVSSLSFGSLAVSPAYASDRTVFGGTDSRVYKSSDGGVTWAESSTGLGWNEFYSLAVSPSYASDRTVFAGEYGGGVYKTTNGGSSWAKVGLVGGDPYAMVSDLAISPDYANDQTVFAGGNTLYKSADGGQSWVAANNGGTQYNPTPGGLNIAYVGSIAVSPNYAADRQVFVGAHDIFGSRDGGTTWTKLDGGLYGSFASAMAASPSFPADLTLFAGLVEATQGVGGGVFTYTFAAGDTDWDGYAPPEDCDDANIAIHPGATEIRFNGADENCNGMEDDQVPGWAGRAPLPIVAGWAPAVALNGAVYLLGGSQVGTSAPAPVQKYDPSTDQWSPAGAPLAYLSGSWAGAASLGGTIYVFGGAPAEQGSGTEVMAFDPATGQATVAGYLSKRRMSAEGAIVGSTLFVVGGETPVPEGGMATDDTIETFDLQTRTPGPSIQMPEPRTGAGVVAVGPRLYIFGGVTSSGGNSARSELGTCLGYDLSTGAALPFPVSDLPLPAIVRVAGVWEGKVYAVAFHMPGTQPNDLLAYDLAANTWSVVSQVPTTRDYASVALLDGAVHVIGGYDKTTSTSTGVHEVFGNLAIPAQYLPDGSVGAPYGQWLSVSGGSAPYTWTLTAGSLPAGLTLSSNGLVSGTPTAFAPCFFTVQVLDARGFTATADLTLLINPGVPALTWANPAAIAYGTPLSAAQLNATANVPGSFVYSPPAGTVLKPGSYQLWVNFTPNDLVNYGTAAAPVTLTVTKNFVVTTPSPLSDGFVGAGYGQTLAASGGVGSYTWNLAAGSLPAGLSLSASGLLSGTPTAQGVSSFSVRVTDANAVTAEKQFSVTVGAARADLTPTAVSGPASGTRGRNINVSATVKNQGQAQAGSFTVTFYLSADPTITTGDTVLGIKIVKSLAVNASTSVGGNLPVPASMGAGSYYVGVLVDSANTVAETDEGNNFRAAATPTTIK